MQNTSTPEAAGLRGIIPPVPTPFSADEELDLKAHRDQIRFVLDKGVHGVCVAGSTGEGYTLTSSEWQRLVEATVAEVAGAVPVIAGVIANSTREAVARIKSVASCDVAAFQVTPVHYVFRPDDEATLSHFRSLTEAAEAPILIYNVVPWNYLSPELLIRIMREVPGVAGVKQSNGDLKALADLLIGTPPGKLVLTAVDPLLYPSFMLGAQGAIAAIPAALPGVAVALWDAVQRGDHAAALRLHEGLLRFWNLIAGDNLPACVKAALSLQGCPVGGPRRPMTPVSADQGARIRSGLESVLSLERGGAPAR